MSESPNAANDGPSASWEIPEALRRYWYLLLIAAAIAGTFVYWWRFYAMTDQGYAPKQPIAFSHKLHAGEHAMDCSYCHFNAHRGKHAGIPPASVCLGCHSTEMGAVGHGLPEVDKMLAIFEGDLKDSYTTYDLEYFGVDNAAGNGEQAVSHEGGVVHWERIHLLPDHVYFSHEFHVAAGVSCQTCHGPVEEMEVVYQFADLTMGWCIECHRNDNYVGGLDFDGEDMTTFTVGVGDYDVIRHRIRPDDVVRFNREITEAHRLAGLEVDDDEAAKQAEHNDYQPRAMRGGFDPSLDGRYQGEGEDLAIVPTMDYFTTAQAQRMERLLEKYPDLPRWRVKDLPETHRAFYGLEQQQQLQHLHNAATHCHTCHQ